MEDYFDLIHINFESNKDVREYSPLVLAYVGDAVYEVFIRTMVAKGSSCPVSKLFKCSIDFVKAKAQSDIAHRITAKLSNEENEILRRGRNAKSNTMPKNAEISEYKYATGLEALIGYLYLKKDFKRLDEVLKICVGIINEDKSYEE